MIINKTQLEKLKLNHRNSIIGLCHGVFDIIHSGHINHFNEAKKKVDILVVSVTASKYVNKGPRQPLNNDNNRINLLNNLKGIDYVFLNKSKDSINVISTLKPDIYFKGKDYLIKDNIGNLEKEKKMLKKVKGEIIFTKSQLMSSTKLFNNSYTWTALQKKILKKLGTKALLNFELAIKEISKKNIFLIGEPIIDRYKLCKIVGTTTKDPAISLLKEKSIDISGGVLAVAKILSEFVNRVNLLTYGNPKILKNFLKNYKNIKVINLSKNQNIQTKTRYINDNRGERLMQVTNFKKNFFNSKEIIKIEKNLKKYINNDLIICDFGIGLFENKILKIINKSSSKKYMNVQTNSINLGFNLFTKYKNFNYLSLDEREWSLGLKTENLNVKIINKKLRKNKTYSLTKGKNGSVFVYKNKIFESPVFVKSVKDTTGSGDAYFAMTTLLLMSSIIKNEIIPLIGNLYAGMHGQYLGNSKIVSKNLLIQNIRSLINI